MTCWQRLRAWRRRGVWKRLHQVLLERLAAADHIDWTPTALFTTSVPAIKRREVGRNPTDKGELGSKQDLVTDRQGIPLATGVTVGNRHDSRMLEAMLDAIPSG